MDGSKGNEVISPVCQCYYSGESLMRVPSDFAGAVKGGRHNIVQRVIQSTCRHRCHREKLPIGSEFNSGTAFCRL